MNKKNYEPPVDVSCNWSLPGNFIIMIPIEGVYSLCVTVWDNLTMPGKDEQDKVAQDEAGIQILANGIDVTSEFVRFEDLPGIKPTGENVRTLIDVVLTTLEAWRGEQDDIW